MLRQGQAGAKFGQCGAAGGVCRFHHVSVADGSSKLATARALHSGSEFGESQREGVDLAAVLPMVVWSPGLSRY
jgi:hypothetical protein